MVVDLPLVTIPPSGAHTHTVILLQDSGAFAYDLVNHLQNATDSRWWSLIQNYASVRWVFPQAPNEEPLSIASRAETITTGIQTITHKGAPRWWWDRHDEPRARPKGNQAREHEDAEGRERRKVEMVTAAVMALRKVVKNEVVMLKGRWDKIILGGIGHGAGVAMVLLATLSLSHDEALDMKGSGSDAKSHDSHRRLGGFVGSTCELPFPGRSLASTRQLLGLNASIARDHTDNEGFIKETPVFLEHFRDHSLERQGRSKAFRDTVVEFGVEDMSWKEYTGGGPVLNSPTGVDDVKAFFHRVLDLKPN